MFGRRSCSSVAPVAVAVDWPALRRLLAEAVILQDAADELLGQMRGRPDPAVLAASCGRITERFAELREMVPEADHVDWRSLRQIFDHHILLLKTSLGLLAGAASSPVLDARLDDIDGLGAPARRLEAIRRDILSTRSRPEAPEGTAHK
jgi:hypothetical protein